MRRIPGRGVVGGAFDVPNVDNLLKIFLDFIILRYSKSYNDLFSNKISMTGWVPQLLKNDSLSDLQ